MNMTRTQWYPANIKPKHIGVYEKKCTDESFGYQYWNGKKWGGFSCTSENAFIRREWFSSFQNDDWRGLKNKP